MNLEELRLNKNLLVEIHNAKKAEQLGKGRTPPPEADGEAQT